MVELSEIFDVRYGHSLELNALDETDTIDDGIAFVSRQMSNNGVSSYVKRIENIEPAPIGDISCALGGNGVLTTCLQSSEFYCGRDVAILRRKVDLSDKEVLVYCHYIRSNRFRYNYGRQANRTLKSIKVPRLEAVKKIADKLTIPKKPSSTSLNQSSINLEDRTWQNFRFDDVFEIKKGYYNKKPEINKPNKIPFIGATEKNNGVTSWHSENDIKLQDKVGKPDNKLDGKIFNSDAITVSNNGSVGFAFYQPRSFTCTHDVNPLYLKDGIPINPYLAMFLCSVIECDRYRWGYGRKWRPKRMPSSIIKLPVDNQGNPDWQFMEDYIKSLPYSSNLEKMNVE